MDLPSNGTHRIFAFRGIIECGKHLDFFGFLLGLLKLQPLNGRWHKSIYLLTNLPIHMGSPISSFFPGLIQMFSFVFISQLSIVHFYWYSLWIIVTSQTLPYATDSIETISMASHMTALLSRFCTLNGQCLFRFATNNSFWTQTARGLDISQTLHSLRKYFCSKFNLALLIWISIVVNHNQMKIASSICKKKRLPQIITRSS